MTRLVFVLLLMLAAFGLLFLHQMLVTLLYRESDGGRFGR